MISHLLTPKTISQYDRNIVHLFSRFNIGPDSTLKLNEICEKDEINIKVEAILSPANVLLSTFFIANLFSF